MASAQDALGAELPQGSGTLRPGAASKLAKKQSQNSRNAAPSRKTSNRQKKSSYKRSAKQEPTPSKRGRKTGLYN